MGATMSHGGCDPTRACESRKATSKRNADLESDLMKMRRTRIQHLRGVRGTHRAV